jgi:hypothetical protein
MAYDNNSVHLETISNANMTWCHVDQNLGDEEWAEATYTLHSEEEKIHIMSGSDWKMISEAKRLEKT